MSDRDLMLVAAAAAIAFRLPFLTAPLSIDEGGYAYVASQWSSGDGGLYGMQWVDRPPLLIAMYAAVQAVGGDLGIRLLGCLAAAVLVTASMAAARVVAGRTGLVWAGASCTVLVSSTLLQSYTVNAELPAAALVAVSAWLTLEALVSGSGSRAWWASIGAGVAATCAVLVKQSFVDGLVFAGLVTASWWLLSGRGAQAGRVLIGGVVGIGCTVALVAVWASTTGPGVDALVDALYGFRLDARTIMEASTSDAPRQRAVLLALLVVASGMLALLAYVVTGLARLAVSRQVHRTSLDRTLVRASAIGLAGMAAWAVFAIVQGGNWWTHYLMQAVPMLSIGIGVVVGSIPADERSRVSRGTRVSMWAVASIALVSWVATVAWDSTVGLQRGAVATGDWLRAASRPSDTALVTWGHPNVLQRSGLVTPYDLVWSLPVRVRDPQLQRAKQVVAGADAPTWIIEWQRFGTWGLDRDRTFRDLVEQRYERVSSVCGKDVYRLREASALEGTPPPPAPSSSECGDGNAPELPFELPGIDVPGFDGL